MIIIYTRNFTIPLVIAYIGSYFLFFPFIALINDNTMESGQTYKTIFPTVFGGGALFYLSAFLSVSIVCLPIYASKVYEMVVKSPKFY
jgi:hypothetical protein